MQMLPVDPALRSGLARVTSVLMAAMWLVLVPALLRAEPSSVGACDQLAGHPADPQRTTPGVAFDVLDGARAKAACEAALGELRDNERIKFQLGRAYQKLDRF